MPKYAGGVSCYHVHTSKHVMLRFFATVLERIDTVVQKSVHDYHLCGQHFNPAPSITYQVITLSHRNSRRS